VLNHSLVGGRHKPAQTRGPARPPSEPYPRAVRAWSMRRRRQPDIGHRREFNRLQMLLLQVMRSPALDCVDRSVGRVRLVGHLTMCLLVRITPTDDELLSRWTATRRLTDSRTCSRRDTVTVRSGPRHLLTGKASIYQSFSGAFRGGGNREE
jgi:hypothetical protein